jgi:hypothetical protein
MRTLRSANHERLTRAALRSFSPPHEPHFSLVSSLDAIHALRRDVRGLLDPRDHDRQVFNEKAHVAAGNLSDLPHHAILDRGRIVGFWEYDTAAKGIVWATFEPPTDSLKAAIRRTETYVREDLGDARAFSLDSRGPRLAALRAQSRGAV